MPDPVTGQTYYGRGYVQLTWKPNYQTFADIMKIDLVNNPDLALDPNNAAFIIVYGMMNGEFTKKSLDKYITATSTDFVSARKVVNSNDKASVIAGYAQTFSDLLK